MPTECYDLEPAAFGGRGTGGDGELMGSHRLSHRVGVRPAVGNEGDGEADEEDCRNKARPHRDVASGGEWRRPGVARGRAALELPGSLVR
jgi:hypothetical protein